MFSFRKKKDQDKKTALSELSKTQKRKRKFNSAQCVFFVAIIAATLGFIVGFSIGKASVVLPRMMVSIDEFSGRFDELMEKTKPAEKKSYENTAETNAESEAEQLNKELQQQEEKQ